MDTAVDAASVYAYAYACLSMPSRCPCAAAAHCSLGAARSRAAQIAELTAKKTPEAIDRVSTDLKAIKAENANLVAASSA